MMADEPDSTTRPSPVSGSSRSVVIEQLYRDHYWQLVGLAQIVVDERSEAEDVVQDGLTKLYASFKRVDDHEKALSYLRSIVLNGARDRLRRRRVHRAAEPRLIVRPESDAPHRLASPDRERVLASIRRLPRRQLECVSLRYYADCSDREIAQALGISVGSVKTHLHRATERLTHELEDFR